MPYQPNEIEKKWQATWASEKTFRTENDSSRPKYYVLDMFPYPSGAGLHVGHPLGYIASDIIARYKRNRGFNVLHPMGWDAFGLPAEQYAIQTGQAPGVTTAKNLKTYRAQLDRIGLSFDWDREVNTSDPAYYKWTQWAFGQMFASYYDTSADKAMPIEELTHRFAKQGNQNIHAAGGEDRTFTAAEWNGWDDIQREAVLQKYRLAYLADLPVNWCPALGTVLANDEVKDGLSVRGGHPVEQRVMKQWSLRISAYADRLLQGLEGLEWSEAIKEMQRNWIGKSEGAELDFAVEGSNEKIRVFTTRPDTIFGASFLVLAPESELVDKLTTASEMAKVNAYREEVKKRTERDRLADVKSVTGVFTGALAKHPFTGKLIPVWTADYVLGGYGTGAIMAVPAHDSRDYAFAKHFSLPIQAVVAGGDIEKEAFEAKDGQIINSDFLNGLIVKDAIAAAIKRIESDRLGVRKVNFRLRDAIFSRQRYWGEPFPVKYKNGLPEILPLSELPVVLPEVDKYLPTEAGDPPLGRAANWKSFDGYPLELSTMPGFAGSSAYFFRYMDPKNDKALVSKEAAAYWGSVDLYIGGSEHATGHLIYSRFWTKFLFDLGHVPVEEPVKKLVNQGLIQGRSNFIYRLKSDVNTFVSEGLRKAHDTQELHVDVALVRADVLDVEAFRASRPEYKNAKFLLEKTDSGEVYRCGWAVEKMSKSFYNVVNPDIICEQYGADTLRLFEMFLGPLEQYKPWNTSGIEGVARFVAKLWRWVHKDDSEELSLDDSPAPEAALRLLHQTIEKVTRDIETLNFNTSVSQFMICVNEFGGAKVTNKKFVETFLVLLSPFAPHLAEELWAKLGHSTSVQKAPWPEADPKLLVADSMKIMVQVNGKLRGQLEASISATQDEVFAMALANPDVQKFIEGKEIKKKIYVPKKLVNFVAP
ncbi:MAG: leucine--tRNA ligase [Proteobacteria bacterium]|nr:MAG: leucine--tRNA ligase [Pseudomonadota bacterium]